MYSKEPGCVAVTKCSTQKMELADFDIKKPHSASHRTKSGTHTSPLYPQRKIAPGKTVKSGDGIPDKVSTFF